MYHFVLTFFVSVLLAATSCEPPTKKEGASVQPSCTDAKAVEIFAAAASTSLPEGFDCATTPVRRTLHLSFGEVVVEDFCDLNDHGELNYVGRSIGGDFVLEAFDYKGISLNADTPSYSFMGLGLISESRDLEMWDLDGDGLPDAGDLSSSCREELRKEILSQINH